MAVASGYGEPGRCAFADRRFHRLDLRWREVKKVPNLKLMLEKHRLDAEGEARQLSPLSGAPREWHGLVRQAPPGTVIHAARVFPDQHLLVEATVVWPERRDAALESAILASVGLDCSPDRRLWQAMGISLELSPQFDLRSSDSTIGRVKWEFAADRKSDPQLTVERLAMPEHWLKGAALLDWLVDQLPPRQEVIEQGLVTMGNHRAHRLISRGKTSALASLRGLQRLRLDLAWQCPIEDRIYHLTACQVSRERHLDLPGEAHVTCCRPVPEVTGRRAAQ